MRLATSDTQTTRRAHTPPNARTLVALAGIAWASCAIAQTMPPAQGPGAGTPSVQQPNDDPTKPGEPTPANAEEVRRQMQQRADQINRLRGDQLAPPESEEEEAPPTVVASDTRPGGGGIMTDGNFSIDIEGPMDLSAFVELVSEALQINIIEDAALQGHTVLFRAPLAIPMSEVLPFLRVLLDDATPGFVLVYDDLGFYRIRQQQNVMPNFDGPLPTTRIIPTPLVRPSSLQSLINTQVGGQPTFRLTPIDELGILMVTGTPNSLATVDQIVGSLLGQVADQKLFPFRLQNVSAVYARSRVIQLNGQATTTIGGSPNPQAAGAGNPGALSNLDSRLFLDQGNTLLFRGSPAEAKTVRNLIEVVDIVAPLIVRRYVAGSVATEAARAGERLGLGPVSTLDETTTGTQRGRIGTQQQLGAVMESEPAVSGFTVDAETGSIIYYGTASQHDAVEALIDQFKATSIGENIEIKTYKLLYAKAEGGGEGEEGSGVAAILQSLIEEPQRQTTRSPFIPETSGRTVQGAQQAPEVAQVLEEAGIAPGEGSGTRLIATTENTIIVSDPARNQIIIKAPAKAQEQFERIIKQLDQKQPQVMIDVQIVAVITSDNFKWASDVQFNFGQFSWFSGFGVTAPPASGDPFDPRVFPTPSGVSGLTTGIIKSDMVPVAIQVLQSVGETRVLSRPSILVNDNQEASMASEKEVPYSSASQGTSTTITSQGGTAKAGTTLTVTPRISEGGDITLDFQAELSDFTAPATGGLQPPAQRDTYQSSVTLPSDSTVVVGGFRLDRSGTTESKIPLLGDIPLLGNFFKSYSKDLTNSVIFVFITPRVMRDPFGADLQLITEGPMAEVGLDPDVPVLEPALMPIVGSLGAEQRVLPTNPAADLAARSEQSDQNPPVAVARD